MTDQSMPSAVGFPWPELPDYPRRDGQPLRGLDLLRFRLRLLLSGHPTIRHFQRRAWVGFGERGDVLVDGKAGPQTWAAYWLRRHRSP